ncbi:13052_t:CDS:2, partial [Dentiscutata heterogama]
PYRRILGQDLWDDITAKFMTSDAVITSNILPARKKVPVQLPLVFLKYMLFSS